MKYLYLIIFILINCSISFSQVLLESPQGDPIVLNPTDLNKQSLFGTFNATEQSLGLRFFFGFPDDDGALPSKILSLGVKAKPTDGIATLVNAGKLNVGANFSGAYTKIKLFAGRGRFIDFLNINVGVEANKYTLFKGDTIFKSQTQTRNFNPFSFSLSYNGLLNGEHLFSISYGYQRRSNYNDLTSIELRDQTTYFDSTSKVTRIRAKITQAKEGVFKEFDSYPFRVAYSYLPADGGSDIKPGFSVYLKKDSSIDKRIVDLGVTFFLTKDNNSGTRVPVIGLTLQANDFGDIQKKNNGLNNRLSIGLTSVFTLVN
ncbi:hypothetical protein ACFQ4C_25725 [Larkinella insperata]|uniref:Uncharacterized protein n=1 Tax=Larkinella insperata TaxID=332158 RepID=A0ABW3QLM8_9BACT|nr:hypothetical protein [Larkinella insperata]